MLPEAPSPWSWRPQLLPGLHPSTSSASLPCILPCSAHPPRPKPPPAAHAHSAPSPKPRFRPGRGLAPARARAPAMLITLCYLYLWARWGRRPAALVLSTVRRLRASRCSFTFCRAAAQPGGARVCLSRGGRVFCVGESQVGGGRGRRVDGARRRRCSSARTAHARSGAGKPCCALSAAGQLPLPRVSGPAVLQGHPGHPSWHLVFPWASLWFCRRAMAAAPHWEGGTGRLHRLVAGKGPDFTVHLLLYTSGHRLFP